MITAIMLDSREPTWVQQLTFGGIPTTVTMLDQGDLWAATEAGEMLIVERKTADDLLNTLREGRLFPQLADLTARTRWCYLAITGQMLQGANGKVSTARGDTGWEWAAVQGALLTVQEMGVFVIHAGTDTEYENTILRLGARDRNEELLILPPKFPRVISPSEAIIASLPGIGFDRMKAVLDYAGTPAWALVALTDLNTEIPGVGRGVKAKVRAALKLHDAEQLAISVDDQMKETLVITQLGGQ